MMNRPKNPGQMGFIFLLAAALAVCGAALADASVDVFAQAAGENPDTVQVIMDGKRIPFNSPPVNINGGILVPLRGIFEALEASFEWDDASKTVTAARGTDVLVITVGSVSMIKNGQSIHLDMPAQIINGSVLVPLRAVTEGIGAKADYDGATKTVVIVTAVSFISLGDVKIALNETEQSVISKLGEPDRIDPSPFGFEWHVYSKDPRQFIMVGISKGFVAGIFTNARGFITADTAYGGSLEGLGSADSLGVAAGAGWGKNASYYWDPYEGIIHAALITSARVSGSPDGAVIQAQEREIADLTNVFRVNHGLAVLAEDAAAGAAARKHSADMAERGFFAHDNPEGLASWDRYSRSAEAVSVSGVGENIFAGTDTFFAAEAFNGWVNSEGHRDNMLKDYWTHMGVGYAHSGASEMINYYTQMFLSAAR